MRSVSLCVVFCVLLVSGVCKGQSRAVVVEAIPPGEDRIEPILKGQPAPFAGQLYDNDTALRWANWLMQYKFRARVVEAEQRDICKVYLGAQAVEREVARTRFAASIQLYERKVAELQYAQDNPPWYKSPAFYVGAGATGALLAAVGSVLVIGAAQ